MPTPAASGIRSPVTIVLNSVHSEAQVLFLLFTPRKLERVARPGGHSEAADDARRHDADLPQGVPTGAAGGHVLPRS